MEYNGIILTLPWIGSLHIAIALHAPLITSLTSIIAEEKHSHNDPLIKELESKDSRSWCSLFDSLAFSIADYRI